MDRIWLEKLGADITPLTWRPALCILWVRTREWRSGSAIASQAMGRGFESRLPLHHPNPVVPMPPQTVGHGDSCFLPSALSPLPSCSLTRSTAIAIGSNHDGLEYADGLDDWRRSAYGKSPPSARADAHGADWRRLLGQLGLHRYSYAKRRRSASWRASETPPSARHRGR